MKRFKLMIPGPVELSDRVLRTMAQPVMGHRTPDFEAYLEECWDGLREVYKTKNDIVLITGSGTAGMDAAVASTVGEGDEYVCIGGGKFGERFYGIVEGYGGRVRKIEVKWGEAVDPNAVEEAVEGSDAKAITLTHNETSTGVIHDAEAIGRIARKHDLLFIVDAITSLGGDNVETDGWGVDLCISGSQKCLAAPPGLAMVSVSERSWEVVEKNRTKNYYLNLASYEKSLQKRTTPFTPSVSLIFGLRAALEDLKEEGLENRIRRHRRTARACRAGVKAMNLSLLPSEEVASSTLTAILAPEGINADTIRKKVKEHGYAFAGGQEHLKGRVFRIGHMGNIDGRDLLSALDSLEKVLGNLGHEFESGSGVRAAKDVLVGD
ncbi:MAG: pyridoxal-phosphate-dependent aminotransferase family protein [Candidatus Hydrothermarchaeaceae archaeon]